MLLPRIAINLKLRFSLTKKVKPFSPNENPLLLPDEFNKELESFLK